MQVPLYHAPPTAVKHAVTMPTQKNAGAFLRQIRLRSRDVKKVKIVENRVEYDVNGEHYATAVNPLTETRVIDALVKNNLDFEVVPPHSGAPIGVGDVVSVAWIALMASFLFFRINPTQPRKKRAEDVSTVDTRFSDVEGIDAARAELEQLVRFLKDPDLYENAGATIPRGCLLCGPPGCGKTLLAKALAGEAGVPFIQTSGSSFVEVYVGAGAARVRDLFTRAKAMGPCIVFIDEIDAVARKRGGGGPAGNDERDNTLNELLVQMDGFVTDQNVIVLAATNFPEVLDPAILRPGRFDRRIDITLPTSQGRRRILETHSMGKHVVNKPRTLKVVAGYTEGFSGADLRNLLNESAILAAERNKGKINEEIVLEAFERRIMGIKRDESDVLPADVKRIAYHEAGHALMAVLKGVKVRRITCEARGVAGGVTYLTPQLGMTTRKKLEDDISILLGGYAAESIFFNGDVSVGASNDLQRVQSISRALMLQFGMGPFSRAVAWDDLGGSARDNVDSEIDSLVAHLLQETKNDLENVRPIVEAVAKSLEQNGNLNGKDFYSIINESMPSL